MIRRELSSAERSLQTARRKELYEAIHPETLHGGDRRSSSRQNGDLKTGAFTKATAAATGQSERNIQRDARRGEKLGGDLQRIKGTPLDSSGEMDAQNAQFLAKRTNLDETHVSRRTSRISI